MKVRRDIDLRRLVVLKNFKRHNMDVQVRNTTFDDDVSVQIMIDFLQYYVRYSNDFIFKDICAVLEKFLLNILELTDEAFLNDADGPSTPEDTPPRTDSSVSSSSPSSSLASAEFSDSSENASISKSSSTGSDSSANIVRLSPVLAYDPEPIEKTRDYLADKLEDVLYGRLPYLSRITWTPFLWQLIGLLHVPEIELNECFKLLQ